MELRGLARWLTTVYPYMYLYIMHYIRFFAFFTFYLVGYFIRPKPQTSTLFTFFFLIYPILINTDEFSYISYREEGLRLCPVKDRWIKMNRKNLFRWNARCLKLRRLVLKLRYKKSDVLFVEKRKESTDAWNLILYKGQFQVSTFHENF